MLEINLLPVHKRVPEGTPPARLAAILISVLLSFVGVFLAFNFYLEEKQRDEEIANTEADIAQKESDKKIIQGLRLEKENILARLQQFISLKSDRLIWNRILFRIAQVFGDENFAYATLDRIEFSRKNMVVDVKVSGWITAGIKSNSDEDADGYTTRLYTEGYKLRRGLEVYTGAYHRFILEKTVFQADAEYQEEVKEIEDFLGGTFTRWKTETMEPSNFTTTRYPPAKEEYRWVLPKRALKFAFSSSYTKSQPATATPPGATGRSAGRGQ
ncbi:MAG: hypothetical protein ABIH86_00525 [Planctomycetota bacterium]